MLGKTLGRYAILSELGSGGMATVYRARDTELGREVAIKMMHPHLAKRPEYAERFRREARAVAALRHPHIIEIHDFVSLEDAGSPVTFMVSELVEGPSLADFLEGHERILAEVSALLGAHIADALACAHGAGIIHRDVKPENVLIATGGRVVLTDFGIARVIEGDTMTATGALIGSPSYMSPEQAKGLRPVAASDIFSLGVLLYRLATGRLPFGGKDPLTVITAILKGEYRSPVQVAPGVGTRFDRIVRRCLEAEADERYPSAEELADDLMDFTAEGGLTDGDGELRRYFSAPEAYEASATPVLVATLLDRAERRMAEGSVAAALTLCDRAMTLEPGSSRAERLLAEVARRRQGQRWIWVGAGLVSLAVMAVVAFFALRASWGDASDSARGSAFPPATHLAQALGGSDAGVPLWGLDAALSARDGGEGARPTAPIEDGALADSSHRPPGPASPQERRRPPPARTPGEPSGPSRPAQVTDAGVTRAKEPFGPLRDAGAPRVRPMPAARDGGLQVMVLPFCEVRVGGRRVGQSPMPSPVSLPPGSHEVTCHHAPSGQVFRRQVRIEPGQVLPLRGSVLGETQITVRLTRGDRIRIHSVTYGQGRHALAPGRFRYQLLKGEGALQTGWITIPPGRCTLVDSPTPECR